MPSVRDKEPLLLPHPPLGNRQVKVTNRSLLKMIKIWFKGVKGTWSDEGPGVLWAYRTTTCRPTGETPFRLAFGSEAIIPTEVGLTSYWIAHYDKEGNENEMRL